MTKILYRDDISQFFVELNGKKFLQPNLLN